MPPRRFPQDRLAYTYTRPGEPLRLPYRTPLTICKDKGGKNPAPITTLSGFPIPDSTLYIGEDGLVPEFMCTDDTLREVWAKPAEGDTYRLEEAYGPQIQALAVAIPDSGTMASYRHMQEIPSTVWDIDHRLGFDPAGIRVVAVDGAVWFPMNVSYPQIGQVARLTFPDSIAGYAWVS